MTDARGEPNAHRRVGIAVASAEPQDAGIVVEALEDAMDALEPARGVQLAIDFLDLLPHLLDPEQRKIRRRLAKHA